MYRCKGVAAAAVLSLLLPSVLTADARLFDMDRTFKVGTFRNYARTTYEYRQAGEALAEAVKRATLIASTHWLRSTALPGQTVLDCGKRVNAQDAWKWVRYKGELPADAELIAALTQRTLRELVECLREAAPAVTDAPPAGDGAE